MATRIQLRRDTAAQWTANNPTLATGEAGYETDTGRLKIGNGSLAWNSLSYVQVALGTDTTGNYVATVSGTDGVSVSGSGSETAAVTIANTDKGSSQNIFKNIAVSGQSNIVADTNDDTLTFSGGTGITLTTNATTDTLTVTNSGVTSLSGTTNQITASASTGSVALSLPSAVTFPGTVTLNADPAQALQAATKQYVDAVAQGLHVHASAQTATTANIANLAAAPATIDGVTLTNGMRVLVKNQSTTSQNGIYVFNTGALTRATDFDSSAEIQGGDFIFVTGGTINNDTGWVQTETVTTVGTDPILFQQFSGAGTYTAGNGLTLTGSQFSINTGVTADLSTAQTLTNKTINGANNTLAVRLANDITGFGTGIATFLATPSSANLAAAVTDETGTGALVFANSPTFTTPNIGVATGTSFNSITGLSSTTPAMDGTAAVGTGTTTARADHVHPTDTTRAPLASPTFTGTVTAGTLSLTTADTVTAASHYWVETASDGIVRPKTLADVRTEIVTTTAVNSAAATTVGTVTSGTWSATNIALNRGGTNASLTAANGGVVYSTDSAFAITAAGTAGQVLTSNGAGAPTWQAPSGGGGFDAFLLSGM